MTASTVKMDDEQKLQRGHVHGNYSRYYGFRNDGAGSGSDPRLEVLDESLFSGKKVLDIGCNIGLVTIEIARRFGPHYIMGVDIDDSLILEARKILNGHHRKCSETGNGPSGASETASEATRAPSEATSTPVVHDESNGGRNDYRGRSKETSSEDSCKKIKHAESDQNTGVANNKETEERETRPAGDNSDVVVCPAEDKETDVWKFPDNVMFKTEDFVLDAHAGRQYDVISCLSTSKWIHLNHGDDGLRTAFRKISSLLVPGGTFIFEPQPWKSYKKKRNVSKLAKANYQTIKLRPNDFESVLRDEFDLEKVREMKPGPNVGKGFDRTIYIYKKRKPV